MSRLGQDRCLQSRKSFILPWRHCKVSSLLSPAACLAVVLLSASPAQAQVSAAISGRVTDPAGATVSGAAVTAKNVETGEARSTVTDAHRPLLGAVARRG